MSDCCQNVFEGKLGPMPFSHVVAMGYYDGILSGLLKCGRCGREFKFDTLYNQLDLEGPVRFFSLAPLPSGSIYRLEKEIGEYHRPQWPIWVPLWSFPTEEITRTLNGLSEIICAGAGSPEWVLAWELGSNQIVASRPYPTGHIPETPAEWAGYCGLPASVNQYPDAE